MKHAGGRYGLLSPEHYLAWVKDDDDPNTVKQNRGGAPTCRSLTGTTRHRLKTIPGGPGINLFALLKRSLTFFYSFVNHPNISSLVAILAHDGGDPIRNPRLQLFSKCEQIFILSKFELKKI
jgi:hypothetical protein